MITPTAISDADRRAADSPAALHTIMCSEIWGANSNVAHSVGLPGLQGWVYSAPIELGQDGGDIHYLSVCEHGVLCRVALADVSGHGRAVTAAAEHLLGLMRRHINETEQRHVLSELSDALQKASGTGRYDVCDRARDRVRFEIGPIGIHQRRASAPSLVPRRRTTLDMVAAVKRRHIVCRWTSARDELLRKPLR